MLSKQPQITGDSRRMLPWLLAAIVLIASFIAMYPALSNDFTNWDDPVYVTNNKLIQNLDLSHLGNFFREPVSLNYHPLTMLSLALDYRLGKLDPFYYHLTNLLIHLLNTLLVFGFLFRLHPTEKPIMAFVVAIGFGIHPMHVESVAWISERKDVLYTFFLMASLLVYLEYLKSRQLLWLGLCFLLFSASLLSKAVAVVLPLLLWLTDYYKQRPFRLQLVWEKIPFLAASLVIGIAALRIQSAGAIADFDTFTLFQRIMFASYGCLMYVVKLILPMDLSPFYPYPLLDAEGRIPLIYYIAPFLVLAWLIALWVFRNKAKIFLWGSLWYMITIALVLQFISVGRAIMADRYSYLPAIGIFAILGYGLQWIFDRYTTEKPFLKYGLLILLAAYMVTLGMLTHRQTGIWKNSETLWTAVIDIFPRRVEVAYKNRGNYFGQNGRPDEALADYKVLVAMNTKDAKVYSNLGNIYGLNRSFDEALAAYSKAIQLQENNLDAYLNRGITYSMMGDYTKALLDFEKAVSLNAREPKIYQNRAYTYLSVGEFQKCIADYDWLIRHGIANDDIYFYRGLANYRHGQLPEALIDFSRSVQLNPRRGGAWYNISVVQYQQGNYAAALTSLRKAKETGYAVDPSYEQKILDLRSPYPPAGGEGEPQTHTRPP